MEFSAPQIAGRGEPFHSELRDHLKGHIWALGNLTAEMLMLGLSVRDIEDPFHDESRSSVALTDGGFGDK